MVEPETITVLYGGVGPESEISQMSGRAIGEALEAYYKVKMVPISDESLPVSLDVDSTVVFPALHGYFGEDGKLQTLLLKPSKWLQLVKISRS